MNLLLLISALLSALSGIGGGVRPSAVAVAERSSIAAAVTVRSRAAAVRPAAGLPALIEVAFRSAGNAPLPVADEQLWALRRRV